ncbi:hypothetical protein SVAN01_08163 [Stagonosporopsis vannaccii]|nr:hypothetical protein SVAN01_08163 [Stagonosporopsis vannaccii]
MARAKTTTRKTRVSFEVHKSPKKQDRRPAAANVAVATTAQLRKRFKQLKAVRKLRVRRLSQELLGSGRRFAGRVVIPAPHVASQTDTLRLKDIRKDFEIGKAAVYWVDGSEKDGYSGAGVVWQEGRITKARYHSLGHNTGGCSGDAELFAIAAAMRKAKRLIRKGSAAQLVRIYSDAQVVLCSLASGHHSWIGPLQDKKTVLQELYDNADWLVSHNIRVEVLWVKGHSASEGNRIADTAASKAVSVQIARDRSKLSGTTTQQDVRKRCKNLGPDWSAEWLYRMHRQQLISAFKGLKSKAGNLAAVSKMLEICEAAQITSAESTSERETDFEDGLMEMPDSAGLNNDAKSSDADIAIKQNITTIPAMRPPAKQGVALPGRMTSTKMTNTALHTLQRRAKKVSADTQIALVAESTRTRSNASATNHVPCIPSLLIWGTTTELCATRLRKQSRLDNIEH